MLFLKCFLIGFGVMFGVEVALGVCFAIKQIAREVSKNERN